MPTAGPVLALDSSTTTGSVAVGDECGLLAEVVLNVAGAHSAALLPAADQALRSAGLVPADLRGVIIGGGPGSFTGLRIAAATAKGIVRALEIPMLAYPSLLAAAVSGWGAGDRVCALFDARHRDVFAACYRFPGPEAEDGVEVVMEPCAMTIDGVLERFGGEAPPLFVGDGAVRHRAEIQAVAGARVIPPELGLPRASSLLWLAARAPRLGAVADAASWEPDYVRAPGVERIAAARAGPAGG